MKTYHIQFDVTKKIGKNCEYQFEISPFDFLNLINTAEEEEGFRLEFIGNGIRCMINDEEVCTMKIWECKHECNLQPEEDNI